MNQILSCNSQWCEDSFKWYHSLWITDQAPSAGIHRIGGYIYGQEPCKDQVRTISISRFRHMCGFFRRIPEGTQVFYEKNSFI